MIKIYKFLAFYCFDDSCEDHDICEDHDDFYNDIMILMHRFFRTCCNKALILPDTILLYFNIINK